MILKRLFPILAFSCGVHAKTFQNSYVSFEVPDNWTCAQEGVAWTCTAQNAAQSKEAVIVLAAKVAGPEDNVSAYLNFLRQPKKITTKVGTPIPSQVMYAQQRMLAGSTWVQAQHLSSEIHDYYTLYLATVKDQLAILVSFTAERNRYQVYNPIFDRAMKTLKIVASQQLLFPKNNAGGAMDAFGIQGQAGNLNSDVLPPPLKRKSTPVMYLLLIGLGLAVAVLAYFRTGRKKISSSKKSSSRPK